MTNLSQRIWIAPCLLTAAGCQSIASNDVKTAGIYADLSAASDGMSTTVEARLKTGGSLSNTYLDLQSGDSLTAYDGNDTAPMSRNSVLGEVWYSATFAAGMSGDMIRVDFERAKDMMTQQCLGSGAPNSVATLPEPFTMTGPTSSVAFSRAKSSITVTWTNSGQPDPMNWSVGGTCIAPLGGTTADTGSLTIAAGQIHGLNDMNTNISNCAITIGLSRSRAGRVDAAYGEGGSFGATQGRQITVQSAP
jgi:hypothetical protein